MQKNFSTFWVGLALVAFPSMASAETCEEKFTRLLVEGNGEGPVKLIATQGMKGGMKTVNEFRMDGEGNWITEMIDPPTMPWSMVRDDVMYTSADQGESWTKVREVESEANSENARAALRADASTARDVSCSSETMDGGIVETVSGTYTSSTLQGAEVTNAWFLTADGWIARHTSFIKAPSYEMEIEQVLEQVESVEIPSP